MNPPTNRRADGATQEELALEYLLALGYRLVKKNFQFGKVGEIDLVMRDGETYVFVEVKARRSHGFGTLCPEILRNSFAIEDF